MEKEKYPPCEEDNSMVSEPMEYLTKHSHVPHWGRFASMPDIMKIELATYLLNSLSTRRHTERKDAWANAFAGAWHDHRTAEDIIADIRKSRTPGLTHTYR